MVITRLEQNKNNILFCEYYESCSKFNLSLMIDATNRCQLKCGYCYYGIKGSQNMNVDKVFAAVGNLIPVFEQKLDEVNIHYMGGEPLLAWEEILELNARAKHFFEEKGVKFNWSLTSNLIALDERKTEHMIEEKAGIHCSLDGPARIHNKNRPYMSGKPSFTDVVNNIPLALQITPNDTARVTVCPEDAQSLPEIAETILGLGFEIVGLFPAYNMAWDQRTIKEWSEGITIAYQLHKKISTVVRLEQKREGADHFTYCGAGKGLWAIGVDGKLYFCHHFTNMAEFAIIDASQNLPETIKIAIEASTLPPHCERIREGCIGCPAKDYCNGGCWTNNLLTTGDSAIPNQIECQIAQATAIALQSLMLENTPRACWLSDSGCKCDTCQSRCYAGCDRCDGCKGCEESCQHTCQKCDTCQTSCQRSCEQCERSCETLDCGRRMHSW